MTCNAMHSLMHSLMHSQPLDLSQLYYLGGTSNKSFIQQSSTCIMMKSTIAIASLGASKI
jgi:hypothetical protein